MADQASNIVVAVDAELHVLAIRLCEQEVNRELARFDIDLDLAPRGVHRAAMSKIEGSGRPIVREDGKMLKPPGSHQPT
jgi:hypothetical protein